MADSDIVMDFANALYSAVNGEKITRLDPRWKGWYGYFRAEALHIHKPDGTEDQWILHLNDVKAEDWVVV